MTRRPADDPDVVPTWWSPPGTTKVFCSSCDHWFSSRGPKLCPECSEGRARKASNAPSVSPYAPGGGGTGGIVRPDTVRTVR
jgi:hypothetical protein